MHAPMQKYLNQYPMRQTFFFMLFLFAHYKNNAAPKTISCENMIWVELGQVTG